MLLVGWQEWWGAGAVICLEVGAYLHMAQLMPLPLTISCFCKIEIGFTFMVAAHPGSPGKRAVKRVCVCYSDSLCYVRRKQTVIHLPTPDENVTTLACELLNFFIRLKVCCVLSNAGGSEKNPLWCVATGMSGKQCRSKCSEWPLSSLTHASSLFRHWAVA